MMVSTHEKRGASLTAVLIAYLLVCTPPPTSAGMFGRGGNSLVDILAAGLVTKLLMDAATGGGGGGGGGGGQARVSVFHKIGEGLALAAARHHQRYAFPPRKPAASFLKYSYSPSSYLRDSRGLQAEEMNFSPQYLLPPRHNHLMFSEANSLPMMSLPFEDLSESLDSPSSVEFLRLPEDMDDSPSAQTPIFVDDPEFAGLQATSQDVFEMHPHQGRPRYILPRIMRHFVQRILHRRQH